MSTVSYKPYESEGYAVTDEQIVECLSGMAGLVHAHGGSTQAITEAIQAIRDRAALETAWNEMMVAIVKHRSCFVNELGHAVICDKIAALDPRKVKDETL